MIDAKSEIAKSANQIHEIYLHEVGWRMDSKTAEKIARWHHQQLEAKTPTPSLDTEAELDKILDAKPVENVPDDVWGSIHATWTGLWTDSYGKWDEREPSDLFPVSELLSGERRQWLKAALQALIARERQKAREDLVAEFQTVAIPETTDYANGWNDCRKRVRKDLERIVPLPNKPSNSKEKR